MVDEEESIPLSSMVNYGSTNDSAEGRRGGVTTPDTVSVTSSNDDVDEATLTHELLDNARAKFSPKCLFESEAWDSGTASIGNEILNLVKNIVGSGGLSLPAGVAAFGNAPSALIPSTLVILFMGVLNAYSFSLLGRVCAVTKSKTYQEAWDRTVGRRYGTIKYSILVGIVVTCKAILGCWSFSIIIASTCHPLLKVIGIHTLSSTDTLLIISIFILLPLCLLERLSSLAVFSFVGQIGTLVTAFTMFLRYFDGTYLEGGRFYEDVLPEHLPSFGEKGAKAFFSPQALILVSILSTGYVAHYNAPKYYYELQDHTTGRFNIVVNASFVLSAITYVCISSLGFLTFGENSAGFILDNYSYRDPLATISRFGIALSVIFAYPLLFQGGRDGMWDLLGQHERQQQQEANLSSSSSSSTPSSFVSSNIGRKATTIVLLSIVTSLAIFVNDLTFVLSFGGATLSTTIIYIFPPLMFQALVINCTCMNTYRTNFEIKESQVMMWLGIVFGICGATVTIIRTFFSY